MLMGVLIKLISIEETLDKIKTKNALIGIVGLGYVGLPLALAFGSKNFRVIGFDIDEAVIKALKQGNLILSIRDEEIVRNRMTLALKQKQFFACFRGGCHYLCSNPTIEK